jgi:hypothetical protein
LFYDYKSNPPLYSQWQEYFRKYQPRTLVVWGGNDFILPKEGAIPYQRDLKNIKVHLLNTGHFALEEGELIAELISRFLITIRHTIPGYSYNIPKKTQSQKNKTIIVIDSEILYYFSLGVKILSTCHYVTAVTWYKLIPLRDIYRGISIIFSLNIVLSFN